MWMSGIINTSFDTMTKSDPKWSFFVFELLIKIWVGFHRFGEIWIVIGQIRKGVWHMWSQKCCILFKIEIFLIATTILNPLWKFMNIFSEALWWIFCIGLWFDSQFGWRCNASCIERTTSWSRVIFPRKTENFKAFGFLGNNPCDVWKNSIAYFMRWELIKRYKIRREMSFSSDKGQ